MAWGLFLLKGHPSKRATLKIGAPAGGCLVSGNKPKDVTVRATNKQIMSMKERTNHGGLESPI